LRIVVDTNVLVSGILSPDGPPASILRILLNEDATLCFDERILAEYVDVLTRGKFGFDPEFVDDLISFLERTGVPVIANPLSVVLPDMADKMFLEVAASGDADHLITGNLKHFPETARRNVSVVSPREFLDRW